MQKIAPSTGTPIKLKDILSGFCSINAIEKFEEAIEKKTRRKCVLLANSGTTAYYLILRALTKLSNKKEVILPAYTAPSLVLPIRKAGLVPSFCDIDFETFNMDLSALNNAVNNNTLAITFVHMFGLPTQLKQQYKETFLIEDLASAFGSELEGKPVGSFGDVSFVSFNRGKNLSTFAGGAVMTDREDIFRQVLKEKDENLEEPDLKLKMEIVLKTIALSLAVRPWFYTIFHDLISQFKYTELHTDFVSYDYTSFQAGLGLSLFKNGRYIFNLRHNNGLYLHKALSNIKGITLPVIPLDSVPVFNQFPLLINEVAKRDIIHNALVKEDIESTTLYPEPVHRVEDDRKYVLERDPFPKATSMSKRLLLIPTHPYITKDDLKKAVDIILRYL